MDRPVREKTSQAPPATKPLPAVDLFTDGSCRGKKQECGGWAFILRHCSTGVEKVQSGGLAKCSSERAEIHAVITGLSVLKRRSRVVLHTDSLAVVNGISHFIPEWKRFGWRPKPNAKEPVKNCDLWQLLDALLAEHEVTVKWVKSHAGHPENERCDKLSGAAAIALAEKGVLHKILEDTITKPKPTPAKPVEKLPEKPPETLADVDLFTDGACIGNPGPGGWAFILRHRATGIEKVKSGGLAGTTNNRMEMLAVIEGLTALKRRSRVALYSDAQYVVQGITEWVPKWKRFGWRFTKNSSKPIMNLDLWKRLDELVLQHELLANWVRGHAGHPENERCDVLSVKAAEEVAKNPKAPVDVREERTDGLFKKDENKVI